MTTESPGDRPTDFLIITTLNEELQLLTRTLPVPTTRILPNEGSVAHSCELPIALQDGGRSAYRIVVIQIGIGRVEAAIATSNAIRRWQPRYIILVGIAGGVTKGNLNLGDVLIADQI